MERESVLVDSNIYIDLLRQKLDPALVLIEHVPLESLVTCGMVRLEVMRGIVLEKTRRNLGALYDVMCYVPTDNKLWEEATELAWQMDRRGLNIPAQDVIIACCAQRLGAAVLTLDQHFTHVPKLKVYRSLKDLK